MNPFFLSLILLGGALVLTAIPARALDPSTRDKIPPITYVQGMIWTRLDLADFSLEGVVRNDKTKQRYPVAVRTKGHLLTYEFQDQPLQIKVELNPGVFTISKRSTKSGPYTPVSAADRARPILDTDITYDDLSLDFVNWDDVTPLGTDTIKTLDAYVFDAKPGPADHSRFHKVRYWVSTKYWAFLRIDGLDEKDRTVKRVEVQDVLQIGKYYVFKQMKIGTMDPQRNDIALSTTFIDIRDGTVGSGL